MIKTVLFRKKAKILCYIMSAIVALVVSNELGVCAEQTLVVGMFTEPPRLDGRTNSASAYFLPCAVEFLIWPDYDLKFRPQLATSWVASPDGKKFRFTLRKGVKFHCGFPFNAEAVKLNLDGALGRLEGWAKSTESGMIDSIDEVKVLDEYTVEVTLKEPSGILLPNLNAHYGVSSMICPSCLKKYGKDDFGIKYLCGTGPFKFGGWVRGSSVTFMANKDYWNGAPKLDKVVYKIIKDEGARMMALEAGEIDVNLDLPSHEIGRLKKDPKIDVYVAEGVRTLYFFMNTKNGPTADKKVRQAFSHAINISEIVKHVVGDIGVPPTGCIASKVFGADKEVTKLIPQYDPKKAKQLLSEAGWKDSGDNVLRKDGKPLQVTIVSMDHRTAKDREVAEAIQSDLRKIGVECKMQIVEWAYFTTGLKNTSFDMYTYAFRANTGDGDYIFSSMLRKGYHWNGTGYDNPRVQELIALGRSEPDAKKRLPLYFELQKLSLEDAVWVPIFHENVSVGAQKYVKGFKVHSNARPFFHEVHIER
jgi:peptide/nickel transport system substrate-binding protein